MHKFVIAFVMGVAACTFGPARAATITPYPGPGTPNLTVYNFIALSTGDVTGFFAGASAADTSVIGVSVNGAAPSLFGLSNQTSALSQSLDFGTVTAGDLLTFTLKNLTSGTQLSSNSTLNPDGLQHVFAANFVSSGGAIPNGLQVSFEDLTKSQGSDFDYNDASFVFTNVGNDPVGRGVTGAAPLPAALPMFAAGAGLVGLLARVKKRKRPA